MKITNFLRLALTASLLALATATTQAATIQLDYQNNLGGGTPYGWISGVNGNVYAGEFDFAVSGNTTDIIEWDDGLSAFCVQIDTVLKTNATTYSVTDGLGAFAASPQGAQIDRLFSNYYEVSQASKLNSAAMQLALWELTHEDTGSYSLYNGDFQSGYFSGAKALANSWLSSLDENSLSGVYNFHSLTAGNSQDLLTVTKVDVSEPGSLLLLGAGLLALVRVRRRTR